MRKWFLMTCVVSTLTVGAETTQEQMQRLFKERVQIDYKVEDLKRKIAAAIYDTTLESEEITEARAEMEQARVSLLTLTLGLQENTPAREDGEETAEIEVEEKEIPQELADALKEADAAFVKASEKLHTIIMALPKYKALADEIAKHNTRAEEIRVEYEALKEQQQAPTP